MRSSTFALLRNASLFLAVLVTAPGCNRGDVGAPCDHGSTTPPQSLTVSFPAMSCNELVCLYGDERKPTVVDCKTHKDCNAPDRFECNDVTKTCQLKTDYVLRNSMCSRPCSSAADCETQGFRRFAHEPTNCEGGFACRIVQSKGSLCCQPLCVCKDYLNEEPSPGLLDACKKENNPDCKNI